MTVSYRAFISHSSKDNPLGLKLAQDLGQALGDNMAVWYDVKGLRAGTSWWSKIVKEVKACDVFIIIISQPAMDSKWTRREYDMALKQEKLIIPLLYQDCNIWPDLDTI